MSKIFETVIDRESFKGLVKKKFFTVVYHTKDGSVRKLNGQLGVTKHLRPSGSGHTEAMKTTMKERNYLTVYDHTKKDYRTVSCNSILMVKTGGKTYKKFGLEMYKCKEALKALTSKI